jgi:hypothetical protein
MNCGEDDVQGFSPLRLGHLKVKMALLTKRIRMWFSGEGGPAQSWVPVPIPFRLCRAPR